jgi:hypothetical protein
MGVLAYSDGYIRKFPHHHAVKPTRYAAGERLELLPPEYQKTIKPRSPAQRRRSARVLPSMAWLAAWLAASAAVWIRHSATDCATSAR